MGQDLLALLRVGLDRARLGARSRKSRLAAVGWLALAGATATVVSTYFFIQGLAGLAAEALGGSVWVGRLVAGLAVLAALALGLRLRRALSDRAALRRLEAKYAEKARASDRGETE